MRSRNLLVVFAIIFLMFACAKKEVTVQKEKPQTLIRTVQINKVDGDGYHIRVDGLGKIGYEVFYSKQPYKIIILADGASVDKTLLNFEYSDELIDKVLIYPGKNRTNIEIVLNKNVDYKYSADISGLNVDFTAVSSGFNNYINAQSIGVDQKSANTVSIVKGKSLRNIVNASTNSKIHFELNVDGVVRYDYGFITDTKFYVDIFNVKNDIRKKAFSGSGMVKNYKLNSYYPPQKTRLLVEIAQPMPIFAAQNGNSIVISSEITEIPTEKKYIVGIESINVKKYQSVIIKLTSKTPYEKKIVDGNLLIQLNKDVKLLHSVNNVFSYDQLPIKKLNIVEVDGQISFLIVPNGDIFAKVDTIPEGLMISASFDEFTAADLKIDKAKAVLANPSDMVFANENEETDKESLISLNIKDLDVQEAIRLVYFGRNKNIVFGSDVKGKVTLYVKEIPYRQALDIIYKENDIMEMQEGKGLIWIISKNRYAKIKEAKIKEAKQNVAQKAIEPLITEIISVNYGNANDYKTVLSSLLSSRGKIQIEARSNAFVITDTKEIINKVKETLASVDKRTPQVTIEARIVEVLDSNDTNLGIQWGGQYKSETRAYDFPGTVNVAGSTGSTGASGNGGYLVNLPVPNPAGALAMSLGSWTGDFSLDVALSALETRNKTKTISSPKVTTLDNQEAEIKSGGSAIIVPTGDNTQAKTISTGIIMKVTPHITNNDMVVMEIEVEKSSLGEVSANNVTTLEKEAKTQVLLADGETTVLGGIYEDEVTKIDEGIPFLQDIPVLGWLFKKKTDKYTKKELLVFITPKITR